MQKLTHIIILTLCILPNALNANENKDSIENTANTQNIKTPLESSTYNQSGLIIGLESLFSTFGFRQDYEIERTIINNTSTAQGGTTTTTTITPIDSFDMRGIGGGYGLIVGYQGFWSVFWHRVALGMRIYGDLQTTHTQFKNANHTFTPTMLRYGANVDALLDIIVAQQWLNLGGFVGVRIGGKSHIGKDIDMLDRQMRELGGGFPKASFDLGLNLGMRATIAQYHGIELAFSVPIYNSPFSANSLKVAKTSSTTTNTTTKLSGDFSEVWSVGVRYIWTFGATKE